MTNKPLNTDLQDPKQGTLDLVCFSHLRWNFVYQRPQHLMSRCARERRVFFIEEPEGCETPAHLEMEKDPSGVIVVKPYLPFGLNEEETSTAMQKLVDQFFAEEIEEFILWYYTPMALNFSRHLEPALTVYDCMDELSLFKGAPAKLQELEQELISRADLIFTGGQTLYEGKRTGHDNVYLFPSSIDAKHFEQARKKQADPADQADIPHPRLGFFGVLDERMDLELLGELAQAKPDWHLVMLGPVVKIDQESLPQLPNIHYLGMKTYDQLPKYLANWDVALLPFALNDSTRFISPTKIPEYLAGGKPVVSTPIRDVVNPYGKQKLVSVAANAGEFVKAIEKILQMKKEETATWLKNVDQQLSQNSWDYTWKRMMTLIESSMAAKEEENKKDEKVAKQPEASIPSIAVYLDVEKPGSNGNGRSGIVQPFDYLIVGAGFAGSVLAERLAAGSGKKVLIIDRRPHIGGNAYDYHNAEGILVHKYGPHIFHTNSYEVFEYLSRFTEWRPYEHRVLASVDGQLLPLPINLDTINRMYGLNLNAFELKDFFQKVAEPREKIVTSEDVVVSKVGREIYEKFFRNYTRKQWDLDPSELDASVTSRVPIRYNRDDRYFSDIYQVMPQQGYTRLFEQMLDHPNIKIMLNTDYQEIVNMISYRELIFTGPVDEYFDFIYGKLPYRSLQFQLQTLNEEQHQPVAVINYPNEYPYTRVTEFKHLTGQSHSKTTLVYEYPTKDGDPYYPIPRPENAQLYARYQALAAQKRGVYFAGRLATYKYYNMDQVVAQALTLYSKIEGLERTKASSEYTLHYVPVKMPETRQKGSSSLGA
ncbi:MAG TPA: UDP-galactopyranose mutase [Anaerolineales bacterium]|nr:UDP-galactopyranose mutase [Anaerolineales bacterium]